MGLWRKTRKLQMSLVLENYQPVKPLLMHQKMIWHKQVSVNRGHSDICIGNTLDFTFPRIEVICLTILPPPNP